MNDTPNPMESQQASPPPPFPKKVSKALAIAIIAVVLLLIIALLAAIMVPRFLRYREKNLSSPAQEAIFQIRKAYNLHYGNQGSWKGLEPDDAIEAAQIDPETLRKWKFEVVLKSARQYEYELALAMDKAGSDLSDTVVPFKHIVATLKGGGSKSRKVWYDSDANTFHGYGVDDQTEPPEDDETGLLGALVIPRQQRYIEKSRSSEAQTAIATIRKVYDIYLQINGTVEDFTVEQALREARLGQSTLANWSFIVEGNPPYRMIATSTPNNPAGSGKHVWYDVREARYHGYGVDNRTSPW